MTPLDSWPEYPDKLRRAERDGIPHRKWRVGVALSGGGIRSATFSLGIFQGLARRKLIKKVDYLSTVSGGGYFGSFLGALFCRIKPGDTQTSAAAVESALQGADVEVSDFPVGSTAETSPATVTSAPKGADVEVTDSQGGATTQVRPAAVASAPKEADGNGTGSQAGHNARADRVRPVAFLRENGRYLAPNGAGDLLRGAAVAVRNWAAVHVMMVVWAFFLLCLVEYVRLGLGAVVQRLASWWGTRESLVTPLIHMVAQFSAHAVLSPILLLAILVLLFAVVPLGWAYWLVPEADPKAGILGGKLRKWVPLLVSVGAGLFAYWRGLSANGIATALLLVVVISVVTFVWYVTHAWFSQRRASSGNESAGPAAPTDMLRTCLSQSQTYALMALGGVLVVACVDLGGAWLDQNVCKLTVGGIFGAASAAAGTIATARSKLSSVTAKSGIRVPFPIVVGAIAVMILLAVLVAIDVLPQEMAKTDGGLMLLVVTGVAAAASVVMGRTWSFANRSSLHATYEARLRRAYLGASNPRRAKIPLSESDPGDTIAWGKYHPEERGGPIHLVNVTINETISGRSQVEQRDRKGLALAVGPGGLSAGKHHHAIWGLVERGEVSWFTRLRHPLSKRGPNTADPVSVSDEHDPFRVFPKPFTPEELDLASWAAISGAAVSTGMGMRTSLGYSVLAGLANLRLGYWWQSGVKPGDRDYRTPPPVFRRVAAPIVRGLFPVQCLLLDEWLARFTGVARKRWYLSDGGHFENTAAYELIRRRLAFIVVVDAGADPDSEFADMANLVRKARIDFGAEITFLTHPELESTVTDPALLKLIGTPDQLRASETAKSAGKRAKTHAALARVTYTARQGGTDATPEPTWLLWVKPTLTGDEPLDLIQYQEAHSSFPQESTADQFFDEAQWESYRRLGEHIAYRLFGNQTTPSEPAKFGSPWEKMNESQQKQPG